ncbi:MAG: aminotransferase class I/II-fold pyridoxal phosphate-dependent enzyme [Bacteroidetes bacterium]|nr:aminotransferase class I/II-fold pyridoxal phosphate-dependent enzyme [Bacteroidota bacterium]
MSQTTTVSKTRHEQILDTIDEVTKISSGLGIAQLEIEDEEINGRTIRLKGRDVVNFGSCSYLGLEKHPDIIQGVVNAVTKYGSQFSSSRAYASVTLYSEAENLFEEIFERPVLLAPTVTLGHLSNIPVLVGDRDAVILDLQVHSCVQTATQLVKARGVHVELIRHNRMDILEERILELRDKYDKIWYMADGVYSMYGDFLPLDDLYRLLDKYDQLNLYVDDAHGTGWAGKHGVGYVLSQKPFHPRLFLVAGLAKSFAACGGVLVFPDERTKQRVRNCGGTFIFSGPIQPPMLGAIIASAKLHLSEDIKKYQAELQKRVDYFVETCKSFKLPLIGESNSPIFFIGVGKPGVGYNMVTRVMNKGFYINLSVFPSVPYKNTGLRIPITVNHTFEDIYNVLSAIAEQLPFALEDNNSSMEDIRKAFKI